jgi:MFS family permease
MGALLPIAQFRETFGSGLVGSLIQGMYTIGGVCALPFVGIFLDTWGRRCGMFVGSCAVILGTILGGTANHMDQLLASRFFLGKYSMTIPFLHGAANRLSQGGDTPWHLLQHQLTWWR